MEEEEEEEVSIRHNIRKTVKLINIPCLPPLSATNVATPCPLSEMLLLVGQGHFLLQPPPPSLPPSLPPYLPYQRQTRPRHARSLK